MATLMTRGRSFTRLLLVLAVTTGWMVPAHAEIVWTNYTTGSGLGSDYVRGVYAAGSTIYAATGGGLSVSTDNGTHWTNYTTGSGLGSDFVHGVYAAGSTIYAATAYGLSISGDNGTHWTNYTTGSGLGDRYVEGVYASGSTIYAATDYGLSTGVASAPVPEIDPAGFGSVAALLTGALGLIERRRLKAKAA